MLTRQFLTKEDRYLIICIFFISAKTFLQNASTHFLIGQNWITGCLSNPSCKGNGISITGVRPLNIYSLQLSRDAFHGHIKRVTIQHNWGFSSKEKWRKDPWIISVTWHSFDFWLNYILLFKCICFLSMEFLCYIFSWCHNYQRIILAYQSLVEFQWQ